MRQVVKVYKPKETNVKKLIVFLAKLNITDKK